MTQKQDGARKLNLKQVFTEQEDFLRGLIQQVVQQVLEAEMEEALGAQKGERTPEREDGVIRNQAVLVAIGINWDGRRCVLAVELANRESQSSWKEFLEGLRQRGLRGVLFALSDDHSGLRKAAISSISARTR